MSPGIVGFDANGDRERVRVIEPNELRVDDE
jgi:hypothetical protein